MVQLFHELLPLGKYFVIWSIIFVCSILLPMVYKHRVFSFVFCLKKTKTQNQNKNSKFAHFTLICYTYLQGRKLFEILHNSWLTKTGIRYSMKLPAVGFKFGATKENYRNIVVGYIGIIIVLMIDLRFL